MKFERSGNRRTFLKRAALFGGWGILFGWGRPAAAGQQRPLPKPAPSGRGYRLTDHIRKYYETARSA